MSDRVMKISGQGQLVKMKGGNGEKNKLRRALLLEAMRKKIESKKK